MRIACPNDHEYTTAGQNQRMPFTETRLEGGEASGCQGVFQRALLAEGNAEGLHFPVEVASLQPQYLGGAAHVSVVFLELPQDVIALVSGARFLQAGKSARPGPGGAGPPGVPVEVRRQVSPLNPLARHHN